MKPQQKNPLVSIETNQTVCADCSIRRLALFHGVPEADLEWTQAFRSGQYKVKARREVYREAQPGEYLFTIYHGWFALYKTLNNGKRQILRIALPGDMIGFQPDFDAPLNHSASSVANTRTNRATSSTVCIRPAGFILQCAASSRSSASGVYTHCSADVITVPNLSMLTR